MTVRTLGDLALGLAATVLLAAACGGSGGSPFPVSAGPTTSSTQPPRSSPSGAPRATPSSTASDSALAMSRIPLEGRGPIGLAVVGDTAWVTAPESGDLIAVTLSTGANRTYHVGFGGSHVLVVGPGEVLVARFDTGGEGEPLAIVEPESGEIRYVATGPLAGFGVAEDGRLWALGTLGEVVIVDKSRTRIVGRTTIDVHPNEHLDAVAGAGAFWASSDTTPIRRLSGSTPKVTATIETGGGIPLAFVNGIVWGARADELWGIDPATDTITKRIQLQGLIEILDLDVAGDRAWIAARKPGRIGSVVGIEISTGRQIGEADVSLPAGVVVSGDRVWVTSNETDELIGIEAPPA